MRYQQVSRAIIAALDQFETGLKPYGVKADRCKSRAYRHGSGWITAPDAVGAPKKGQLYTVRLYTESLPVRGHKQLVEQLARAGLEICRTYEDDKIFFRACKQVYIIDPNA